MSPQSPDRNEDRDAILARRNLLVSSAMAMLGCSSPQGPGGDTVTVPTPGTATPNASNSALPRDNPGARPDWQAMMRLAPPLDVPARGLPEDEAEQLRALSEKMRPIYASIGRVWDTAPPACDVRSCEAKWSEAAKVIADAHQGHRGPLCGWGSQTPGSYIARFVAASAFLEERLADLDTELAAAAKQTGSSDEWLRLARGSVRPQPCLSCVQMSAPNPAQSLKVLFDEGSDALDESDVGLTSVREWMQADPTLTLIVRGHADGAEPVDRDSLAKARADAVRAFLLRQGIAANRVTALGLGSDLMIESARSPRRAVNRRVDFSSKH